MQGSMFLRSLHAIELWALNEFEEGCVMQHKQSSIWMFILIDMCVVSVQIYCWQNLSLAALKVDVHPTPLNIRLI